MTVAAVAKTERQTEPTMIESLETIIRQTQGMDGQKRVLKTLLEISREIPDNVNQLAPAMAEYLAGRFLKALDICGELYSMAVSYELKMGILKKKEFSNAMLIRSADVASIKTAKEKEMFAHADADYLAAADRHVEAEMFRTFVEEKKETFGKAHYLMRKIVDREQVVDTVAMQVADETEWSQMPKSGKQKND